MTLKGRQRAGFLGDKGQVAKEAGITTARMITQLERAVLDVAATTEEVRASSVTASTGTASISVRYNSGTPAVGVRPQLNFIPGAGITLTVTDDNADDEVDVTVASSAGFGTPVSVDLAANSAGVATTYSRSDHKHDLDESISPTWTGSHVWESEAAGEHRIGTSYPCDLYTDTVSGVFTLSTPGGSFWIRPHSNSLLQLGRGASTYWRIYDDSLAAATSFQIDVSTGSPGSVVFRADDGLGGAANFDLTGAAVYIGTTTCSANGTWTFSSESKHPAGLEVGTTAVSGRFDSATDDTDTLAKFLFKPTADPTSSTTRFYFQVQDSSGNPLFNVAADKSVSTYGSPAAGVLFTVASSTTVGNSFYAGLGFNPTWGATAGSSVFGFANSCVSALFLSQDNASATAATFIGAAFQGSNSLAARAHTSVYGIVTRAMGGSGSGAVSHGDLFGMLVMSATGGKSNTATNAYGIRIQTPTGTNPNSTNDYGIYIEETTSGATINNEIFIENAGGVWFRDQQLYINSATDGHLDLNADVSIDMNGDMDISAKNIITDTTTGTKFGTGTTQKIGFWNATPIVRPATGGAASTFTANTSGIADDTATWDGYTIGNVVKALRNIGLLA